jgi:hypothetical protein
MFTGARFPDSCNGTTNPVQQITVNVLADLGSHQQPKYIRVLHLRNRTVKARETASNVPGLWRISAQTVRNRLRENGFRARRLYFGAVLRRQHRLARVRWCNRVRGWYLQNWRWVVQRWIKIHAAERRWPYTCIQRPEWEVRKELRPWGRHFPRRKCDDVRCTILRPKNLTGAHPRQP